MFENEFKVVTGKKIKHEDVFDVVATVISGVAGISTEYVVGKIINDMIPEPADLKGKILTRIGKNAIIFASGVFVSTMVQKTTMETLESGYQLVGAIKSRKEKKGYTSVGDSDTESEESNQPMVIIFDDEDTAEEVLTRMKNRITLSGKVTFRFFTEIFSKEQLQFQQDIEDLSVWGWTDLSEGYVRVEDDIIALVLPPARRIEE